MPRNREVLLEYLTTVQQQFESTINDMSIVLGGDPTESCNLQENCIRTCSNMCIFRT